MSRPSRRRSDGGMCALDESAGGPVSFHISAMLAEARGYEMHRGGAR